MLWTKISMPFVSAIQSKLPEVPWLIKLEFLESQMALDSWLDCTINQFEVKLSYAMSNNLKLDSSRRSLSLRFTVTVSVKQLGAYLVPPIPNAHNL